MIAVRPKFASVQTAAALVSLASLVCLPSITAAQETSTADSTNEPETDQASYSEQLIVTATHIPVPLGDSGRSVEVITSEEIAAYGVRSMPELLQLLPGLDVRRRGVYGMQADLSVRGASFEQVLILVDGVPMNNPQTGHHNLDLAVPISSIERVEVLYGPGSALHGANAAGGVVQIFTRSPRKADRKAANSRTSQGLGQVAVEAFAGEHSLGGAEATATWSSDRTGAHSLTLARNESDGYRPGTEFDQSVLSYRGEFGPIQLSAGASERAFGAQTFYSTRFPNQRESTEARFANLAWQTRRGETTYVARAGYREHGDIFILERSNPGLLTNIHDDDTLSALVSMTRPTPFGRWQLGANFLDDGLDSSNLGRRDRQRGGLSTTLVGERNAYGWRLSLATDRVEGRWEVHPSLAIAREIGRGNLRASYSSAYRLPSFTELYYLDPVSAGSADLEPETSRTWEIGYDRVVGSTRLAVTAFLRRGTDLIDFVQAPGDDLFRAVNLREVDTRGFELVSSRRFEPRSGRAIQATASYSYLRSTGDEPDGVSVYVFDYLKHRALVRAASGQGWRLGWAMTLSHNERNGGDAYQRLDARVSLPIKVFASVGSVEIFVEGSNLTDERYVEQGAVEMPGRWMLGGVRFRR